MVLIILLQYVVLHFLLNGCGGEDRPPDIMEDWGAEGHYMIYKFNRMTMYMAKDVTLKLRHADRVQQRYRHLLAYTLGSIMAGIQDTFKHMLKVYRKYSNLTTFRRWHYTVEEFFNAYEVIKGDFNEIRYEKDLFYKALDEHNKAKKIKVGNFVSNLLEKLKSLSTTPKRFRRAKGGWAEGKGRGLTRGIGRDPEEEYKRSLRLQAWEGRWKKYVPEVEGVDINIPDVDPKSGRKKMEAI